MPELTSAPLLRAARPLAKEADEQLLELHRLGCPDVIDELALQFHDQAVLADQLFDSGELTEEQYATVKRMDEMLTSMSGMENAPLWTPAGLRDSPQWNQVRLLATQLINSFT